MRGNDISDDGSRFVDKRCGSFVARRLDGQDEFALKWHALPRRFARMRSCGIQAQLHASNIVLGKRKRPFIDASVFPVGIITWANADIVQS